MTFDHGRPAIEPTRPELVLIRHGETEWSLTGQHTGRTDLPLTEHGRNEARHIAAAVAGYDFDHVFASPLQRAWETAQLVGLRPERDDQLMEWDYGEIEGRTTAQYREHTRDWSVWTHPIPGGESLADVGARADEVIDRMLGLAGRIAVVAHGHFLRVLGARWTGLDPIEGRRLVLNTSTLSLLGWERENRVIRRWNDPCGW
ncbi:MAG: histidine phosphatase family protein [Actinomycetota bacterium]